MAENCETPVCPKCGSKLVWVAEREENLYRFNPEKGKYEVEDGSIEVFCPECGTDLLDIFPDGICNWKKP
jgi:hypothetical protein